MRGSAGNKYVVKPRLQLDGSPDKLGIGLRDRMK